MDGRKVDMLESIKVYAFIGPAGTGKSYRAQFVASSLNADYIIDDGLIIHKGSIVCGKSAKSEKNKISAIRRAIFQFEEHRQEVVNYFRNNAPCSVMIVATSDSMVAKILKRLGLNKPIKIIRINDVATKEEIAKARQERVAKGQHVIPVSHVLVRKNFGGKLVGQLRVFWKSRNKAEGEKTIVRPPFSFIGNIHIEPNAIKQLILFVATRSEQVVDVDGIELISSDDSLNIDLKLKVKIGDNNFVTLAHALRKRVAASVKYFTGIDIKNINVTVSEVVF